MKKLPLPKGWAFYCKNPTSWNPFTIYGFCMHATRLITFYPKKWMWPKFVRNFFENRVYKHEVSHAWGIGGCKKPWCIMFEAKEWKREWADVWWERLIGALFQVFTLFRYCKKHRQFMEEKLSSQ